MGRGKVHGWGHQDGHVFVAAAMPLGRIEFIVHARVRKIDEEGLVVVEGLEPFDRVVGEQVGGVAAFGLLHFLAIDVKGWRVIHPLPPETYPLVESRLYSCTFIAHVPFSKKARLDRKSTRLNSSP